MSSKYDRFERVQFQFEDKRPIPLWQKIAMGILALCALLFWLTPDSPSSEIPMVAHHRIHTIHILRRVCDMQSCRMVDVTLHPRVT